MTVRTQFTTRLPVPLSVALADRAEANHRSANAELTAILTGTAPPLSGTASARPTTERAAFEAAMRTLPDPTGAIDYALGCFDPGQERYYKDDGCSGLDLNSFFVVWTLART